jgi:hypothetical protein
VSTSTSNSALAGGAGCVVVVVVVAAVAVDAGVSNAARRTKNRPTRVIPELNEGSGRRRPVKN